MSSAGKSSKSATRFSVSDLSTVAPWSGKKKSAASPSVPVPKPVTSKGKGGKKRKSTEADNLEGGLPLIHHQFEEYFAGKFAEIQMLFDAYVEEAEMKELDFQKIFLAKDETISRLEKELNLAKKQLVMAHITADQEKNEVMEDAKLSAAITMYKTKLQMAQEAGDLGFDRTNWDQEGWKARLAELDDEEEATEVLMLEASDGGAKDQVGGAGAGDDGDGDAAKV